MEGKIHFNKTYTQKKENWNGPFKIERLDVRVLETSECLWMLIIYEPSLIISHARWNFLDNAHAASSSLSRFNKEIFFWTKILMIKNFWAFFSLCSAQVETIVKSMSMLEFKALVTPVITEYNNKIDYISDSVRLRKLLLYWGVINWITHTHSS